MENRSKAQTFLGFAIKTGNFRIGLNAIQTLKKMSLVIICKTTAENSVKKAMQIAKKHHAKVLITQEKTLSELTHRENAKIMAITDVALSKAIIENNEQDFKISQEEKLNG